MTLARAGAALTPPVSFSYLSEVEHGKRPCPPKRIDALAKLYEMRPGARAAVFIAAGVLPPAVRRRVLAHPETWIE